MTAMVVLNDDDIQVYREKEKLLESMIAANRELVKLNDENVELLRKIRTFLSGRCKGNEFDYFCAKELLEAIGLNKADWPEWIGKWREEDAN